MRIDYNTKHKRFLVGVISLLLVAQVYGQDFNFDAPAKGFKSWTPAKNWEEALLSGNGTMGAMVFGNPFSETIILNHSEIYMPTGYPFKPIAQATRLNEIRTLLKDGKNKEAALIPMELGKEDGYNGTEWVHPYIPAFDLKVEMGADNIENYARSVNFETGEATVTWQTESGTFERKLFVSRKDSIVVLRIKGTTKIDATLWLDRRPFSWEQWQMYNSNVKGFNSQAEDGWLTYQCEFKNKYPGFIEGYEGAAQVRNQGGELEYKGNRIVISGADEIIVKLKIDANYNYKSSKLNVLKNYISKVNSEYETLLTKQKKTHGELFNRVKFSLNSKEVDKLDSEVLINKSRSNVTPQMIETIFNAARYNTISACGTNPPNLQGIWGGTWTPPWSSAFTQDGNLPVAVSGLLQANTPELLMSYINYHERMKPYYRENAKRLFGCDGIVVPAHSTSHGWNIHFGPEWCLTFWTGGAGWASSYYYDYWLHTGDRNFLSEKAYPFLKEVALFYEGFLIEGEDEKYIFSPSYSPENNPGNNKSQACINATMDVMVAKQVLRYAIESAEELEIDVNKVALWKSMLKKMPKYQLNEDGELREWLWPGVTDNHHHRHVSHLYGLYDMADPEIASSPELLSGAQKVIDQRMKVRRRENGGEMVFGMAQMAFVASYLKDVQSCTDIVYWLSAYYWNSSLASYHNPGSLFNMDLSGGYSAVIMRMLTYSEPGLIRLLPALPEMWENGHIEGMLLRGEVKVEKLTWSADKVEVILSTSKSQEVDLEVGVTYKSIKVNGKKLKNNKLSLLANQNMLVEIGR